MEVILPVTLSSPIATSSILDDDQDRLLSRRHHHHHHVGHGNGGIVISAKIGTSPFADNHRGLLVRQPSGICRPRQSEDTDAEHADSARVSSRAATTQTGVVVVVVVVFFFDDDDVLPAHLNPHPSERIRTK